MTVRMVGTDSEEEIKHAVSDDWRKPMPPAKVPETEVPPDEEITEVQEDESTALPEETQGAEKPGELETPEQTERRNNSRNARRKRSYQALLQKVEELSAKVEASAARPTESQPEQPPQLPAAPERERFPEGKEGDRQFAESYFQWKGVVAKVEEDAKESAAVKAAYQKRLVEFSKETPDFDSVTRIVADNGAELHAPVVDAISSMDNGPEVFYYLCKNPDIIEDLQGLKYHQAVHVIYNISEELAGKKKSSVSPEPKQRTEPPPPIRPVGGASARSSVPLDELKLSEYVKVRNGQERNRR